MGRRTQCKGKPVTVAAVYDRRYLVDCAKRPALIERRYSGASSKLVSCLNTLLIFLVAMSMYAMQVEQKDVEKLLNDGDCHSCHSIDTKS